MINCPICHTNQDSEKNNFCSTCGWDLTPYPLTFGGIPDAYLEKERTKIKWAKQQWLKMQELERHNNKDDKSSIPNQVTQRKNSSSLDETKVVVSIQIDDSKIGYAYAFRDDKRVMGRTEWDKQPYACLFTKPYLLYAPNGKLEAWGYSAMSRLAEVRRDKSAKDYSFFRSFRMALRESRERDANGPIATASNGQKFHVINLVADYLHKLKDIVLGDLGNAISGILKPNEVMWCLTIPAIWKNDEMSFMRRAAEKAGLISTDESDRERLLLVIEPEAAAIYCQEKDKSQLEAGKRFMVVDCGGGTVDITVHEVTKHGGLEEVAEGTGGAYGSTYVDAEFKNFLASKLTAAALTRYEEEDPIGYLELLANWERKKSDFDPEKTEVTYFDIPNRLYRILSKDYPEVLEKLANTQNGDDERVHISLEMMIRIFTPVLDGLVNKVKEQFSRLNRCDIMYLVGGFSASTMLRQRIQKEFGNWIQIVRPSLPGAAIVEGAALFGLNPTSTRSRRTRLTYGCQTCLPYDYERDLKHRSKRQFFDDKQEWYICNRFQPFVLSGESVDIDEKITSTIPTIGLPSIRPDQRTLSINLFATKSKNPRYVDEIGVEKLAELEVDISSSVGISDRTVEVSFCFGRTEIAVEATDLQTGKTYNTKLRFASTYSIE